MGGPRPRRSQANLEFDKKIVIIIKIKNAERFFAPTLKYETAKIKKNLEKINYSTKLLFYAQHLLLPIPKFSYD